MTPAYVSVKRWRNPMDDPFVSQLRQLTPTVDALGSKTVLNRRLMKSRIRRRIIIAGFSVAGLAMSTFAVAQVADRRSNEVLVVGAPELDSTTAVGTAPTQAVPTSPPPTDTLPANTPPIDTLPADTLPTHTPASDPDTGPISVSYGDDTPLLEPIPFVNVDGSPEVAVGDGRIVVVDRTAATATIIYNTPSPSKIVGLDVVPWFPVINPTADVLYGLYSVDSLGMMEMVAIALEGPRQGEVVATSPLSIGAYIESPSGAFGHGDNGIVDRFGSETTLIGYVDASGAPTKISVPWLRPITSGFDFDYANSTLGTSSNAATWTLRAERSPDAANLYEGETPPAPTAEGGVLVFTHIGPRVEPQADFGTPTGPVVAVLRPDGSGKWYRLPERWRVAASDVWGTVLARNVEGAVELAWLKVDGVQSPSK
jgi:hypothetical protein